MVAISGWIGFAYFGSIFTIWSRVLFLASISEHRISSVAICPCGELLAFGCSRLGQLLVWGWQSETYVLKQQSHLYDMNVMSYSPDGQLIATGGDDGKVIHCFEQISSYWFLCTHFRIAVESVTRSCLQAFCHVELLFLYQCWSRTWW